VLLYTIKCRIPSNKLKTEEVVHFLQAAGLHERMDQMAESAMASKHYLFKVIIKRVMKAAKIIVNYSNRCFFSEV